MARLLEKAKDTLHNGGFSIVVLNQNNEYVSSESGISALLLLLKDKPDMLRGASVADKVVGKAAAMLMVYGCVAEVYAGLSVGTPCLCSRGQVLPYIMTGWSPYYQ